MRNRVVQLTLFQKTTDHRFEALLHSKSDAAEGVLESIMLGKWMSTCTGASRVVPRLMIDLCHLVLKGVVLEEDYSRVYCYPRKKLGWTLILETASAFLNNLQSN